LRLYKGVSLRQVSDRFGNVKADSARELMRELVGLQLIEIKGDRACLTPGGRLVSNEVFERFVSDSVAQ
jgi:coproporphyrinogen III oxidase-like Fe-S oxidoreductase